ncbi:Class I glutamine amidotransferase-like superfamily protein [Theobroma cacao]|uniref:Class I glutamine amidotransferase-like superfamily protein n=1 Tax=Theobroma cacao TaxID=3641 RepID=A0A061E207_THECC|nr:Class I glutamine amidotransferase-like superfamily protein [Theobroma cacao]
MGGGKRFAVLLCAEDSDYVKKRYGGYYGVFVEMLAEEGETWDVFRVASGHFPDEDKIGDYDGFVITGSCNDAHGNDVWICKLIALLKKLDSLKKKVLGICFGHQILGRALGGKTGRAISGWDIGVTTIHLSSSSSKLFSSLKIPATLSVIECHRDEVRELPLKAEVMAWSEKTGVEMFRYGDHMMGIQGHPEYTKDILLHLIDRLLQRSFIADSYADELKANLGKVEPDKDAWKKLCTSFLNEGSLGRLW